MSWDDSGNGTYEGQDVYWHKRSDGKVDVFPGGVPSDAYEHDHVVLAGADVTFFRGGYHIIGGYVVFKRANGVVEINSL